MISILCIASYIPVVGLVWCLMRMISLSELREAKMLQDDMTHKYESKPSDFGIPTNLSGKDKLISNSR